MLKAVRLVVVGLLLWTAYDMAVAFTLLAITRINPVFIILGAALFGFMVYR